MQPASTDVRVRVCDVQKWTRIESTPLSERGKLGDSIGPCLASAGVRDTEFIIVLRSRGRDAGPTYRYEDISGHMFLLRKEYN